MKCAAIKPPSHGTVVPSSCKTSSGVVYKTDCFLSCNVANDYRLEGPSKIFCLENGSWSADVSDVICKGVKSLQLYSKLLTAQTHVIKPCIFYPFIRSIIHSVIHSSICPSIYPFIHSLTCSFIRPFLFSCLFICSLIYSFLDTWTADRDLSIILLFCAILFVSVSVSLSLPWLFFFLGLNENLSFSLRT